MRLMPRYLAALASLFVATSAGAQLDLRTGDKPPRRPKLPPAADTNSALAYYSFGISTLKSRPREAADAFYWALRLDPTAPQHLAARRVALMRLNERRLFQYLDGDEPTWKDPQQQRLDSMEYIARARDPFMHRALDLFLIEPFVANWVRLQRDAGPGFEGWMAYAQGDFDKAVRKYTDAMKMSGSHAWVYRNDRAMARFLLAQYDSTLVDLEEYEKQLRKEDANRKRFVFVYESKAMTEYMKGIAHLARGDSALGQEVLGKALMEDLAFYMAHVRLAQVALARGDTATGIAEYDLAVQAFGTDVAVRNEYGVLLLQAGRFADAEPQFRAAIEQEPHFADLHLNLGQSLDLQGKAMEARPEYEAFIARAARDDGRLPWARDRLASLGASR